MTRGAEQPGGAMKCRFWVKQVLRWLHPGRCVQRLARRAEQGFTLLEVLVAVAILGLGMTVVLSAQTGVFLSYSRATHLSQAPGLARCKMEELELELLKEGYPLLDQKDDGECCEEVDDERYSCSWEILKVKLPNLPVAGEESGADAGVPPADDDAVDPASGADSPPLGDVSVDGLGGPLGALSGFSGGDGALGGISGLAGMMSPGGGAGAGMAGMVMGMVYPDLKPMLEGSIRKVVVRVHWEEGKSERELAITQFVTNPQQGGFDPLDEAIADAISDEDLTGAGTTAP